MTESVTQLQPRIEWQKILGKIFVYHDMNKNDEGLVGIWKEMLGSWSASDIENAWQQWLMADEGNRGKPKPHHLIKLIKFNRSSHTTYSVQGTSSLNTTCVELPPQGASFAADQLRSDLKTMNRNNPTLRQDIASEKENYNKAIVCCSALGKPELIKHPAMQSLLKGMQKRQPEAPQKRENLTPAGKNDSWEGTYGS